MLASPNMIVEAAKRAGMKVPENMDVNEFDPKEYPHFHVYCCVQLCRPITWGNHWHNAEIIAAIPDDQINKVTENDLVKLGFDP